MTRKYSFLRAFVRTASFFCALSILQACLGTKHLEDSQMLLYQQTIKGNKEISSEQLDDFYRQEVNVRTPLIPWAPYVSLYYLGERFHNPAKIRRKREKTEAKFNQRIAEANKEGRDTQQARLEAKKQSKLEKINRTIEAGNWLMRIGEPVAVYDSTLSAQSAQQMEQYLHNKGFFNAQTYYTADTSKRKVSVTYHIREKRGYYIDTTWTKASAQQILDLLARNSDQSFINKGDRYDQENLAAERTRISDLLRDHGYYEFSQQYVEFNVDSTISDHKVSIVTEILRPSTRGYHRQFRVDSVVFVTDATVRGDVANRQNQMFNGINYRFIEDRYSKKVLDNRVFIRPDSLYSRSKTLATQKQLANLDNFRFININYDTANGKFISYIYTNPLKRFQTSNEVGLTYSVAIPGPFFTTTWTMRNVFGGLENLEFNLRASSEGIPSPLDPSATFKSTQYGGNVSLILPQFLVPLNRVLRNRIGRYNPKTRILVGANFTDRQVFSRNTFNSSLNYTWQTERQRRDRMYNRLYTFVPIDISIIDSRFSGTREENPFYQQLVRWREQGNPYYYSFTNSFVSSMYAFVVFNKNNYGTYTQESRYIRPYLESGGTTQNLFDFGFLKEPVDEEGGGRATYRFLKFSNDYRKFTPLSAGTSLAWRINAGLAIPYGEGGIDENGERLHPTLPYEKFFFAGGSNSIRAFRPRRLGPGIYPPEDPEQQVGGVTYTNLIEQPGEVLLEMSIEHRHNIFGFLNGAIFLDAGNVWRLRETSDLPGSQFNLDSFYRQIALGTGYGFRLDFSFLIVRLDLGFKLFNPQSVKLVDGRYDYSAGWIFNKNYGSRPQGVSFWDHDPIILNIGIGYPF